MNKEICLPVASKDDKIYHTTTIDNFVQILELGGIASRFYLEYFSKGFEDVADQVIIEKRKNLGLDKMIPFHFIPKTPFGYAVNRNNKNLVIIAIDRLKYINDAVIYTAHPLNVLSSFPYGKQITGERLAYETRMWEILNDKYLAAEISRGNDKYRQIAMAEFNVKKDFIPLQDFIYVFVKDRDTYDLITKFDKKEILKEKIIVGDERFVY